MTLPYQSLEDALESLRYASKSAPMRFEGPQRIFVSYSQWREIQVSSYGFEALRRYRRDRRRVKMLAAAERAFSMSRHFADRQSRRDRMDRLHKMVVEELGRRGYESGMFGLWRLRKIDAETAKEVAG